MANNEVIIIHQDIASYGMLTKKTVSALGKRGIIKLNKEILTTCSGAESVDELREKVSELLQGKGMEPLVWPLPEEVVQRIKEQSLNAISFALLLTKIPAGAYQ